MSLGEDFRKYVCQTSDSPMGLEISEARGPWLYTSDGDRWLDLISGIGVVNIGHGRDEVLAAIQAQAERYLHTMVYGEFIMEPQVAYARALAQVLPGDIDNIFFTNSGTEAVEGAIKLARKFTGRQDILSFDDCYHGDTMGSLSCQSSDVYRRPFEPLVPGFSSLPWNDVRALEAITDRTAGVIIEPVQGEAGVRIPDDEFMQTLRRRTRETGALLIFDEVMTGFGRTGKLFAAEHWQIEPDIMVLAKALGGGLPLGAFAAPAAISRTLAQNPPLSHVTTFGGNPLCCAAGHASLRIILSEGLPNRAQQIGARFVCELNDLARSFPALQVVRGLGCLIGIDFPDAGRTRRFVEACARERVIVGWTLHHSNVLRMAPPLVLTEDEITYALQVMRHALEQI